MNEFLKGIIKQRKVQHILFWTGSFIILYFINTDINIFRNQAQFFTEFFMSGLVYITITYINLRTLLVRYFKTQMYYDYFRIIYFLILGGSLLLFFINNLIIRFEKPSIAVQIPQSRIFFYVLVITLFVIISSFFYFIKEWLVMQDVTIKLEETEKEKILSELQALKAQINPHFLFNTLNNLYYLALEKSDKTPDMILKLSELMSYIIYDCKAERVPLLKEIEFLQNYIDLERLRLNETSSITTHFCTPSPGVKIAPMILIPFMENAFKHGTANRTKSCCNIDFSIDVDINGKLHFVALNALLENKADIIEKSGIGIENTRKRLDLIYPTHHELFAGEENGMYKVDLYLDLDA
ncbi:MAG: sensor histidine kinase [Bacteroidales bacterium]|nr:sensor histidine kinase [Bacteroidales bacterium]